MKNRIVIFVFLAGVLSKNVTAQISPGELSRAHEQLEGLDHCTECHEQGEEITGNKCTNCHTEIRNEIKTRHGFHFQNAASNCVSCHKEHLGRDAGITLFDKQKFDHRKTGFPLTGKHSIQKCEACHSVNHIKDPVVVKNMKQHPHQTYLGLRQQCNDCHKDRHDNSLGPLCQNCHTSDGWKPAASFSHAKTKYPLLGKHENIECMKCHESLKIKESTKPLRFTIKEYQDCNACHQSPHGQKFSKQLCSSCHTPIAWSTVIGFDHSKTSFSLLGKHVGVACVKCHTGLATESKGGKKDFTTKPFRDCTPCHVSPHAAEFSKRTCSSCHNSQQWALASENNFDHNLTSFALKGKHAFLKCAKCHISGEKKSFKESFKLANKSCTDCHQDKHKGQFAQTYANDCSRCHTEDAYIPCTYSIEQHRKTQFALTNAHVSVPCKDCHEKNQDWIFHFKKVTCELCHQDRHNGQFSGFMKKGSCETCHSTISWKSSIFDHSQTSFPLVGQHASAPCSKCHLKESNTSTVRYKGTSKECSDCHTDPHAGQFIDKGKTDCSLCHTPIGRRASIFRHDLQSRFALTGAHKNVECGGCHKPEQKNGKTVIRYKPLPITCESCHQGKI